MGRGSFSSFIPISSGTARVSWSDEFYGIDDYEFRKGKSIQWDPRNKLIFSEYGIADDFLAHVHPSATVISKKMKHILENELKINGLEFYPVPVVSKDGKTKIEGYYVMNILNIVRDALDRDNSLIDISDTGGVRTETVLKYCLKENKIKNFDVFRIGDGRLFVSSRVKDAFDKAHVTGIAY